MNTLTRDKYLDEDELKELERILTLIESREPMNRDSLLIRLAIYCGAREGELITIESCDLDPKLESVFIKKPEKGSSKRAVPLPRDFFKRLHTYAQGKDGLLFPISTSMVRKIWGKIRPWKQKKFHSLRHTFGRNSRMKLATVSGNEDISLEQLEKIQYMMGHKSIQSTMIYIGREFEANTLRKDLGL